MKKLEQFFTILICCSTLSSVASPEFSIGAAASAGGRVPLSSTPFPPPSYGAPAPQMPTRVTLPTEVHIYDMSTPFYDTHTVPMRISKNDVIFFGIGTLVIAGLALYPYYKAWSFRNTIKKIVDGYSSDFCYSYNRQDDQLEISVKNAASENTTKQTTTHQAQGSAEILEKQLDASKKSNHTGTTTACFLKGILEKIKQNQELKNQLNKIIVSPDGFPFKKVTGVVEQPITTTVITNNSVTNTTFNKQIYSYDYFFPIKISTSNKKICLDNSLLPEDKQ